MKFVSLTVSKYQNFKIGHVT